MKDELRHDIVQRWQQGQSQRQIADELGVSRRTVGRALAAVSHHRAQGNVPPELQPAPPRTCAIDAYEAALRELLQRHPQLTARRCWQELRAQGFTGSYKQVWSRVRALRPRPSMTPVVRFETDPGQQAQSDYSLHDLDFAEEGRRRVRLVEEAFAGVLRPEQTTTSPIFDRTFRYLQPPTHFRQGEQSLLAQSLVAALEGIRDTDIRDCDPAECLAFAGTIALLIQPDSDLLVREIVEPLVDQRDDLGSGLPGLVRALRQRQDSRLCCSALEANLQSDLLAAGQGDIFDQQLNHSLAFAM